MAQARLPHCTVTHYFADHHSKLFWDAIDAGREYSVDYVTVLDFQATDEDTLIAIHKKSVPMVKRFGQVFKPESGLAVITDTITRLLGEGTWQRVAITYNEESSAILICHYALDEASIVAFNAMAVDILDQFGLTAETGTYIVTATPHLS